MRDNGGGGTISPVQGANDAHRARHMRIHDLRHTYASLARSAGADLKLLQQTMGHASITVTDHTYADLFDSDLDRVADALDTLNDGPQTIERDFGCHLDGSDTKSTLYNRAAQR